MNATAPLPAPTSPVPTSEELETMTTLRLSDLMRHGAAHTRRAVGFWGAEEQACALSAAALALEALERR